MSIFVFGSNLAGIHGAGAARDAMEQHGAQYGVGVGRTGDAYAIPTKDRRILTLPLHQIMPHVQEFILYAREHLADSFFVSRLGCGLAGYKDHQIATMFRLAPSNCILPIEWRVYHDGKVNEFHSWDDNQAMKVKHKI